MLGSVRVCSGLKGSFEVFNGLQSSVSFSRDLQGSNTACMGSVDLFCGLQGFLQVLQWSPEVCKGLPTSSEVC